MSRLLPVFVMFVYGASVWASAALVQRDYGVKLCGREFIRAVIFTCGGSRWRRAADADLAQSDETDSYLPSSYQNPSDGEPDWSQSNSLTPDKPSFSLSSPSSPSLNELIQAMEGQTQTVGVTSTSEEPKEMQLRSWLDTLFSSRPLGGKRFFWSPDSRKKRNFSLGLAGMCCNQGCTKNDIGRLC